MHDAPPRTSPPRQRPRTTCRTRARRPPHELMAKANENRLAMEACNKRRIKGQGHRGLARCRCRGGQSERPRGARDRTPAAARAAAIDQARGRPLMLQGGAVGAPSGRHRDRTLAAARAVAEIGLATHEQSSNRGGTLRARHARSEAGRGRTNRGDKAPNGRTSPRPYPRRSTCPGQEAEQAAAGPWLRFSSRVAYRSLVDTAPRVGGASGVFTGWL